MDEKLLTSAYGRAVKAVAAVKDCDLRLPIIVVVGDENQGKSSTLERLARKQVFPRGEGFTTRLPVKLCMKNSTQSRIIFRHIQFPALESITDGKTGEVKLEEVVDNPPENVSYEANVKQVMDAFIQMHVGGDDDGRSVVENELIEISVSGPTLPNLDLYDLPGIVGAPFAVAEQTRRIAEHFLANPNTLALCVVSARNTSIRNSQALGLVEKHGAQNRTVTVLTQVDRGEGPELLEGRMKGTASDMYGINHERVCAVKNRGPDDKYSLAEAEKVETEWFETMCPFGLRKGRAGVHSVIGKLNDMMEAHMRDTWCPAEIQKLEALTPAIKDEIKALGPDPAMGLDQLLSLILSGLESRLNAYPEADLISVFISSEKAKEILPDIPPNFSSSIVARTKWEVQMKQAILSLLDQPATVVEAFANLNSQLAFSDESEPELMPSRFTALKRALDKFCADVLGSQAVFDELREDLRASADVFLCAMMTHNEPAVKSLLNRDPRNTLSADHRNKAVRALCARVIIKHIVVPLLGMLSSDDGLSALKVSLLDYGTEEQLLTEDSAEIRANLWARLKNIRTAIDTLVNM